MLASSIQEVNKIALKQPTIRENSCLGPVVWLDRDTGRYQLIGIISHGVPCGSAAPAVNTRVTEYLQWIIDQTSKMFNRNCCLV